MVCECVCFAVFPFVDVYFRVVFLSSFFFICLFKDILDIVSIFLLFVNASVLLVVRLLIFIFVWYSCPRVFNILHICLKKIILFLIFVVCESDCLSGWSVC